MLKLYERNKKKKFAASEKILFRSVREQRGSQLSAAMSIMTLSTNQLAKNFTSGADEKSYRSRQEKNIASVFCSKSKKNALFLKTKHAF